MTNAADVEQELLRFRKTIIIAIASDDALMERLVLKGGNALDIIHKIGERSSVDVDFSMADDFDDEDDLAETTIRLFRALRDRFDSIGYVLFDERLEERPRNHGGGPGLTAFGGYNAKFKLISKRQYQEFGGVLGTPPTGKVLEMVRFRSREVGGPGTQRNFEIEISKFEYVEGRVLANVEEYDCYVYTPAMIAAEKLRAICQQLPEYQRRAKPSPRPRDFYDIHTIATRAGCDIASPEHHALVESMFAAKEVPISLLRLIGTEKNREFHGQQWTSVTNAVRGGVAEPFSHFFQFTVGEALRLLKSIDER